MKERNSTAAISVKAPVIGLPRAMLYDRYEVLWKSFFSALGMKGIVSKPTNKAMIEAGSALSSRFSFVSDAVCKDCPLISLK